MITKRGKSTTLALMAVSIGMPIVAAWHRACISCPLPPRDRHSAFEERCGHDQRATTPIRGH